MHATVEQLIKTIFTHENEDLKVSLLVQSKLVDRLMEAYKAAQEDILKPKGVQKGYIGHLAKIVSIVYEQATSDKLKDILKDQKDWQELAPKIVEDLKLVTTKPLGGAKPSNPGAGAALSAAMLMGPFSGLFKSLSGFPSESSLISLSPGNDNSNDSNNPESNYNEEDDGMKKNLTE
jgi:hypothetical protein